MSSKIDIYYAALKEILATRSVSMAAGRLRMIAMRALDTAEKTPLIAPLPPGVVFDPDFFMAPDPRVRAVLVDGVPVPGAVAVHRKRGWVVALEPDGDDMRTVLHNGTVTVDLAPDK